METPVGRGQPSQPVTRFEAGTMTVSEVRARRHDVGDALQVHEGEDPARGGGKAGAEYRRHAIGVMARRALLRCV